MLDIGFQEMAVIAVIALIIIGPKDLPRALRGISQFVGKARSMAREFRSGLDDIMNETDLAEMRDKFTSGGELDFKDEFTDMIDPTGSIAGDLDIADDTDMFEGPAPAAKSAAGKKGTAKPRAAAKTGAAKSSSKPRAAAKAGAAKSSAKPRAAARTSTAKVSAKPRARAAGGKAKAARAKG